MFNKIAALTSVLFAASALVRAEVTPSEPGPGSVYTAGQECTVSWDGDRDSDTIWKDMSIQLMTGDNFNMIHLTSKHPLPATGKGEAELSSLQPLLATWMVPSLAASTTHAQR